MLPNRRSLALAFASAVLVLATGASSVFASTSITAEPSGFIELDSVAVLVFRTSAITVECGVTLNGRLRRGPIAIAGGTLGEVTEGRALECRGGSIERFLFEAPRVVASGALLGALPEGLTGLLFTIREVIVGVPHFGARCLYRADVGLLTELLRTGRATYSTGFAALLGTTFNRVSGSVLCPLTGTLSGTFFMTQQTLVVR